MLYFGFGNFAFNDKSSESTIFMIVSAKCRYNEPQKFLTEAFRYLDEKIDPGYNTAAEYEGASLKEGQYLNIVEQWISTMNERIEIQVSDILKTYRIKHAQYDPFCDEFLLETANEYILFHWSTAA